MEEHAGKMSSTGYHLVVVALCLAVFVATGLIAILVFEQVPHLEDEVAYLFQAKVFSIGKMYVAAPFHSNCFFAPFVLDYQGRRFGKYPPGWPALLAIGVRLGQAWWVNAASASLTVALVYRLAREVDGPLTGITAAALASTSPFVLLLSGSLMSHPTCLLFVTAFRWCFWRALSRAKERWAWAACLMLGCAFAVRPFTAAAVAVPAGLYSLWRLVRFRERRRLWFMGLGCAPVALAVPAANAVWTGDPFVSPYVLFWPYDRIGFGPGHGLLEGGNTVWVGLGSAVISIGHLATHLQGWPALSLSFVVLLFMFKPRRFWSLFLASSALCLILAYVLYWTNGDVFGPRYIYESSSALFVLSASGIVRVGQWARDKRLTAFYVLLGLLLAADLIIYLPWQFREYKGLYGVDAGPQRILRQANLHNALVIVQDENGWKDYAVAFSMNAPTLDGDIVYASDCSPLTDQLLAHFPGRSVYYFDGQVVRSLSTQGGS
jgi:hypothetical protein